MSGSDGPVASGEEVVRYTRSLHEELRTAREAGEEASRALAVELSVRCAREHLGDVHSEQARTRHALLKACSDVDHSSLRLRLAMSADREASDAYKRVGTAHDSLQNDACCAGMDTTLAVERERTAAARLERARGHLARVSQRSPAARIDS